MLDDLNLIRVIDAITELADEWSRDRTGIYTAASVGDEISRTIRYATGLDIAGVRARLQAENRRDHRRVVDEAFDGDRAAAASWLMLNRRQLGMRSPLLPGTHDMNYRSGSYAIAEGDVDLVLSTIAEERA